MNKIPAMQDMSMDASEAKEFVTPSPPKYPYGLCISLCQDELEKLGLDDDDLSVGDMVHIHALAKVTSVSSNETEDGADSRVELVLAYISAEDEDEENEEEGVTSKLYKR